MKKKHLLTALFAVLVTVASAQSNYGIFYFGVGEFETAKEYFNDQLSQSPAESNYYLGEIAWAEGKVNEAKAFYEKGLAADPLYVLNNIGLAKLELKSNQKAAEATFATVLKKNKKNAAVNIAIARAYYENGMKDLAIAKIALSRKYCKKSPLLYTLEGDMLQAEQKYGEAAGKYEQAVYFDPQYTVAQIKCAHVYEPINPALSVEILKKVIANHPDYTIAYRNLGKSYCQSGQYQSAIEAFKTYFAKGKYSVDDITKFASAYYFTDNYNESIKLIDEGLRIDPSNFVLNRLRMYNASKTKDVQNGLNYANYFFSLKSTVASEFITQDYSAYASILSEAGQYEQALEQYDKVLKSDNANAEIYKEISSVYGKMGNNAKAAEIFEKYIEITGVDNVTAIDYYSLGRTYYAAGIALLKDSSEVARKQGMDFLIKADTTFGIVCQRIPESYTGYMWRGHTNAAMDPETTKGLAKPYYEQTINAIQASGSTNNKTVLINAYQYLGYYYYLKHETSKSSEDKANSIKYWNKILELDPENANAIQVLGSYKQ